MNFSIEAHNQKQIEIFSTEDFIDDFGNSMVDEDSQTEYYEEEVKQVVNKKKNTLKEFLLQRNLEILIPYIASG